MLVLVGKFATKCVGGVAGKCQFIKTKTFVGISSFSLEKFNKCLGPRHCTWSCTWEGCLSIPALNMLLEEQNLGTSQEGYKNYRLGKGGVVRKGPRPAPTSAVDAGLRSGKCRLGTRAIQSAAGLCHSSEKYC